MINADLASLNIATESVGALCSGRKTTLLATFLTTFRSIALYTPKQQRKPNVYYRHYHGRRIRNIIQPPLIFSRCIADRILIPQTLQAAQLPHT